MRTLILIVVFVMVSTLVFGMQLDTTFKKIVASDSTFLQNMSSSRVLLYTTPIASSSPDTNVPAIAVPQYSIIKVNPSERNHFVRVESGVGFLVDVTGVFVDQIHGNIELGDVTVEALPSYKDSDGLAQRALIDSDFSAMINVASDTIGLIDAIASVSGDIARMESTFTEDIASLSGDVANVKSAVESVETAIKPGKLATQTITLVAGVPQELTSGLSTRRSVYFSSHDPNQDIGIWSNLGGEGTYGDGVLFFTGVKLNADETYSIFLIASEAVSISVVEEGEL